jgi:hypothetical protein
MSFLFAVIGMVRERATRLTCASNQRQLTLCSLAWSQDNRGRVPQTLIYNQPKPSHIVSRNNATDGTISVDKVENYMDGADQALQDGGMSWGNGNIVNGLRNVWRCPADRSHQYDQQVVLWYYHMGYSYWAGADTWPTNAGQGGAIWTTPDAITDRRLSADRLLWSDTLYFNPNGWFLAAHARNWSRDLNTQWSAMTGMNQAFGDGRVAWKSAADLHVPLIVEETINWGAHRPKASPGTGCADLYHYF